jgi:hypothetical protein
LFKGLEQLPEVMTDPRSLRGAYLAEFGKFLASVQTGCRAQQIDYQRLRTDQSLGVAMSHYLATRMAKVK